MKVAVINCSAIGMKGQAIYNLGVDRIANYHLLQGDEVVHKGGWSPMAAGEADKVYFSVIFTWDIPAMVRQVDQSRDWGKQVEIGGPAATFMANYIVNKTGVLPHRGLDQRFEYVDGEYQLTFTSRGCPHSCEFCLPYGTKVLMADCIWRNIEDIKIGEEIIGVIKKGIYYRYSKSEVLGTFEREAEVFTINTTEGKAHSTIDHPWLMGKGAWKSIEDIINRGKFGAQLYSTRSVLRKVSSPQESRGESEDYKWGYLVGCHQGDGYIGFHKDKRRRNGGGSLRSQLVGDNEMLDRALAFANSLGLPFHERPFNGGIYKRCNRTVVCETNWGIKEFLAKQSSYFSLLGEDFIRGYLAGIFDAEGSFSQTVRIANNNNELKIRVSNYLAKFNFLSKIERKAVRLLGGLPEQIRFLSLVQPAVKRKCNIYGTAVKNASPRILSVESEGIKKVCNLRTTTENFIADGFITHNCGVKKVEPLFTVYDNFPLARMIGDNNILATPFSHQERVVARLKEYYPKGKVDINSGFDVRFFKPKHFKLYSQLPLTAWRFAFDSMAVEKDVRRVARYMTANGLDRHKVTYYVLIGFPGQTVEEAFYRFNTIINLGHNPYPMRFWPLNSLDRSYVAPGWTEDLLYRMSMYYQTPYIWKSDTFENFVPGKKPVKISDEQGSLM